MYDVTPAVPRYEQITKYDCWHACLRMMIKWRSASAEPRGSITNWVMQQCVDTSNWVKNEARKELDSKPSGLKEVDRVQEEKFATDNALRRVPGYVQQKSLGTFKPFSQQPGLTTALLPSILAENGLRSVRGRCCTEELGATSQNIEDMLRAHGPLYLLDDGHVIVVTGINGDQLRIIDPQNEFCAVRTLQRIQVSPCVARLAGTHFILGRGLDTNTVRSRRHSVASTHG